MTTSPSTSAAVHIGLSKGLALFISVAADAGGPGRVASEASESGIQLAFTDDALSRLPTTVTAPELPPSCARLARPLRILEITLYY